MVISNSFNPPHYLTHINQHINSKICQIQEELSHGIKIKPLEGLCLCCMMRLHTEEQ